MQEEPVPGGWGENEGQYPGDDAGMTTLPGGLVGDVGRCPGDHLQKNGH